MFEVFTRLADLLTYRLLGLDPATQLAGSVHFFIEDVTKIYTLLLVMIYVISFLRAGLDTGRIRAFLSGKSRGLGYLLAAVFGSVTPFCSCSSIPLFLGFTSAGIPLGITMAFLITSPMINEVAVVLLGSMLGMRFMLLYVATGLIAGILGGYFMDLIGAERYLTSIGQRAAKMAGSAGVQHTRISGMRARHDFAREELKTIFTRVWRWVLIGVGLGALLHGFVPEDFISDNLGSGNWWSVPAAVILGIPLYANASGVIPVIETLLQKGLPVGTALAFMMSIVAASLPEFMMLKQVMRPRLLLIFFLVLLVFFTIAGWVFNVIY